MYWFLGKEDGLGVENLKYAGMIASETSLAYQEIVTISMVSCRAIGIGSYLVRLGQRLIQIENSHIILTGYSALNKVLGREVYASNNQLGGIQIVYNNGVSHKTDPNDLDGIYSILKWLSYIPKVYIQQQCFVLIKILCVKWINNSPVLNQYLFTGQIFYGTYDHTSRSCR